MTPHRLSHALRGLREAFVADPSIRVHTVVATLALLAGAFACLTPAAWVALVVAIGIVLAAELMNSALETLADALSPGRSEGVRRAKDMAATSVLVLSIVAVFVGIQVFLPPLLLGTAGTCFFP